MKYTIITLDKDDSNELSKQLKSSVCNLSYFSELKWMATRELSKDDVRLVKKIAARFGAKVVSVETRSN